MAISETITIDAGPAVGALDELAAAAARADEAMAKLKMPSFSGAGAGNMARGLDAAAVKMQAAVDKMEASFAKLKSAGAEAGAAMGDIGKAGAESAAGLSDAAKGANDAAASYARLGKASRDSAALMDEQAVASRRVAKASAEGAAASQGFFSRHKELILGTGLAIAYSVDKAMKFNSEMTLLNTQAGVSTQQMPALTKGVLELAGATGQSPGNLAESLYHVASNMESMPGTTTAKMLNAVKIAAEGAATGHSNLTDTTTALTSVLASGIPGARNYSQAMGVLNATVGVGEMNMQQLADALSTGVVPVVKGYGLNLKDVGAALADYGDLNIRGAKAGTELRMAVQALAVQSPSATKELKSLGLSAGELGKNMQAHGLLSTLNLLDAAFKKHGITAQNEGGVITDLFGKKAGAGLALLLENMDRVRSKYPALTEGANKFGEAWDKTLQTPQQKLKQLEAGAQSLAITAGNVLMPAASGILGGLNKAFSFIQGNAFASHGVALGAGALVAGGLAKGLFSGVESGLSGLGKIGSALKIPGLDKLANLGGGGLTGAAADLSGAAGRLSAAAGELSGSAGKLDTASAAESRGGAGGGKGGSVLGAATLAAGGAWLLGHVIGAFLPKSTSAEQQAYQKNIPGWLQAPTNFVFGSKAASLYNALPSGADLWHSVFGGGVPPARPAAPLPRFANGKPFYGEVPAGLPHPANFRAEVPVGVAAPIPTYANGRPFYGEVPVGVRRPAPGPFYGEVPAAGPAAPMLGVGGHPGTVTIKPKIQPPDTGAISSALAGLANSVHLKPVKMPAPDMSALNSAKGKAQAAGAGITSAIESAMHKPAKLPPPDLSAGTAAAGRARGIGSSISAGLAAGILSGDGAVVAAASKVANDAAAAMAHAAQTHSPSKKTIKTGKDVAAGLVVGLEGGKAAVDAAAAALGKQAAKATDIAAIDATTKKLISEVPKGDSAIVKMLRADNRALDNMARTRARLEQEISDSEQVAKNMVSGASITNALNAVNPAGNMPVASAAIVTGQQYQAASLKQFAQALQKDKALGLNATSLSQIAQAGPDQGLGIAQGIASGGKDAVKQLNTIQRQIQASAAQVGNVAGPAWYIAGQDVAKGLAAGLKSELASLDKAMETLAKSMVHAVQSNVKKAKDAARKAGAGTAKHTAAGAASGAAAPASGGSVAAAAGAGKDKLGAAAAGLSAAGASLSSAASALSAAAAALSKSAGGGGAGGAGGHGGGSHHPGPGGGSGRIAPGTPAYGGGHYGTPAYLPSSGRGGQHVHYHQSVTVQGSVMTERDLLNTLQEAQLTRAANNWNPGWNLPGRPN